MGSLDLPEEQPVHRVRITQPFLLAETEVTVEQWRHHVERHGGDAAVPIEARGPQHPMFVSHDEALGFCRIYGYRLPTEAEWEWACRGGDQGPQHGQDGWWRNEAVLLEHAWFHLNAGAVPDAGAREVATRRPNPLGLHDMLGNVWEWCADRFGLFYVPVDPVALDPTGPELGSDRVLRGGSWFTLPAPTPHTRIQEAPFRRMPFFGFRPAVDLAPR